MENKKLFKLEWERFLHFTDKAECVDWDESSNNIYIGWSSKQSSEFRYLMSYLKDLVEEHKINVCTYKPTFNTDGPMQKSKRIAMVIRFLE